MPQNILRLEAVQRATGLKHSSIYAKIGKGEFPRPIKLSAKAVGWLESDVQAWQEERIAERDAVGAGSDRAA